MNINILKLLQKEFPSTVVDIRDALELLEVAIDNSIDKIGEKINYFYSDRNYEKVSELSLNSRELNTINNKIQDTISKLDSIMDNIISNDNSKGKIEKGTPNYADYLVDKNIEHTLNEDYTNKKPASFSIEGKNIKANDWKSVLIKTLNYLAEKDSRILESFINDKNMNGKKVLYFSDKKEYIKRAPKKVDQTNIYVETNQSANSIIKLISKVLDKYNISLKEYKIYFRADYSELH